uniref:Uncharacterized protein n=1 Tax=Arion vulgaris TaxID=1028688 RepID=A0A0B7AKX1_9EUPU
MSASCLGLASPVLKLIFRACLQLDMFLAISSKTCVFLSSAFKSHAYILEMKKESSTTLLQETILMLNIFRNLTIINPDQVTQPS